MVVVKATTTQTTTNEFGQGQPQQQSALGSGFLIDREGHILTNGHVVAGDNPQITVGFADSSGNDVTYKAKVLGIDTATDVAVLQPVESLPASSLDPLPLGIAELRARRRPGGRHRQPLGEERTITSGIVSALEPHDRLARPTTRSPSHPDRRRHQPRQLRRPADQRRRPGDRHHQPDPDRGVTASRPAASASASPSRSTPPARSPTRSSPPATPQHPYIGVKGLALTPALAQALHISTEHGFLVEEVNAGSPAEKAGLQGGTTTATMSGSTIKLGGDVITAIDGHQINEFNDLYDTIASHKPGDTLTLTVIRDGQTPRRAGHARRSSRPASSTVPKSPTGHPPAPP